MVEEETPTEEPEETPELSEAEKVTKDTEELKAKNDAYDVEKLRAEKARAEKAVGGQSEAGAKPEEKEETDKEYSDRIDKEIADGKYNG